METLQVENPTSAEFLNGNVLTQERDELTLTMKSVNVQESAMPDNLKQEKQTTAPSLETLFEQTIQAKGEMEVKKSWISNSELEIEGLSDSTLHSFALEAEKLGKKITYTRTLQVKISD